MCMCVWCHWRPLGVVACKFTAHHKRASSKEYRFGTCSLAGPGYMYWCEHCATVPIRVWRHGEPVRAPTLKLLLLSEFGRKLVADVN